MLDEIFFRNYLINILDHMIQNDFYLVRHGESENNILEIDSSKLENKDQFGLTEKGRNETKVEAQKFKDFDLIITSPFKRAKETAMIFAHTSECEVVEEEILREVNFGDFDLCKYKMSDAFFEKHKDESIPFPNGESYSDARKRAVDFFGKTNKAYKEKKILIVSHGWIVFYLIEYSHKNFDSEKYLRKYGEARSVVKINRS